MRVLECFVIHAGKNTITSLTLDGEAPSHGGDTAIIDGKQFVTLRTHGLGLDTIGIEGEHDFLGKEVVFLDQLH